MAKLAYEIENDEEGLDDKEENSNLWDSVSHNGEEHESIQEEAFEFDEESVMSEGRVAIGEEACEICPICDEGSTPRFKTSLKEIEEVRSTPTLILQIQSKTKHQLLSE